MLADNSLIHDIKTIITQSREQAVRAVNHERTVMYWHSGQRIFEEEQRGKERADYGAYLVQMIAERLHLNGDDFFADLVFYNRLLQCFVIIEIKTHKLTHQDIGQLQMYVNYYDRMEKQPHENPTIGILLCADKNDAVVKFSLPENQQQIIASQYRLYLPSEEILLAEMHKEIAAFEQRETLS